KTRRWSRARFAASLCLVLGVLGYLLLADDILNVPTPLLSFRLNLCFTCTRSLHPKLPNLYAKNLRVSLVVTVLFEFEQFFEGQSECVGFGLVGVLTPRHLIIHISCVLQKRSLSRSVPSRAQLQLGLSVHDI